MREYYFRVGRSIFKSVGDSEKQAKNKVAQYLGVTGTSYIRALRKPTPSDINQAVVMGTRNPPFPGKLGTGERFAACVTRMEDEPGVYDPEGLCAAIGRRKYGSKGMARLAAGGRQRNTMKKTTRKTNPKAGSRYGVYVGPTLAYVTTRKLDANKAASKLKLSGRKGITIKSVGLNPVSGKVPKVGWREQYKKAAYAAVKAPKARRKAARTAQAIRRGVRKAYGETAYGTRLLTAGSGVSRSVNPSYLYGRSGYLWDGGPERPQPKRSAKYPVRVAELSGDGKTRLTGYFSSEREAEKYINWRHEASEGSDYLYIHTGSGRLRNPGSGAYRNPSTSTKRRSSRVEYVIYPDGLSVFGLVNARRRAKAIAKRDGYATIQKQSTGENIETVYEDGSRKQNPSKRNAASVLVRENSKRGGASRSLLRWTQQRPPDSKRHAEVNDGHVVYYAVIGPRITESGVEREFLKGYSFRDGGSKAELLRSMGVYIHEPERRNPKRSSVRRIANSSRSRNTKRKAYVVYAGKQTAWVGSTANAAKKVMADLQNAGRTAISGFEALIPKSVKMGWRSAFVN